MKSKHEEAFRAVYPRATIESHKTNGPGGKRSYLVRIFRSAAMPFGEGSTKAAAWRDAASKLPGDLRWSKDMNPIDIAASK